MVNTENFISSDSIILMIRELHNHLKSKDTKVQENHSWPSEHLDGRNPGKLLLIISPDYSTQAGDLQVLSEKLL